MNRISLRQFPGVPALVAETLDGEAAIDFGFPTRAGDSAWREASARNAGTDRPRDRIADAIRAQNEPFSPPRPVLDNIEALAEPGTLAVVTGQQVGLAGGPMLTLYKAITAVALADDLQRSTGVRTVPVFWMATSDHNLQEAAQLHWIDLENRLAGTRDNTAGNRTPVGSLPLGERAHDVLHGLQSALPETEFSESYLRALRECYMPERTFADAFRDLGLRLLGRYGLVFFDPQDPAIKRISSPFLQRAVEEVDDRLERLAERSRAIERAGYRVQAPVEPGRPALFLLDDGRRRKIVLEGRSIRARTDIILSRDELFAIARDEPERLSAGVTLRPILQGWLIPTGAYVAGPHEMAYWAQLADAFDPLSVPKPAVIPRCSLTLIEPKVRRWLDRHGLHPADLFGDADELTGRLLASKRDGDADRALAALESDLARHRRNLFELAGNGEFKGLDQAVESSFSKLYYHVDRLRHSFAERSKRRHGDVIKHVEQLATHLAPAGRPQERVLSPFYYFVRYGDAFLAGLRGHCLDAAGGHGFVDIREWL